MTEQVSELSSPLMPQVPFVSVVLAVRNEAAFIVPCLRAVLAQEWPVDRIEVLVADGESTDGTPELIRALPDGDRVQVLKNPRRRQAAGLNAAIARARGDIIVRVDGHTLIAPDYVLRCVAALGVTGAACAGGRIEPVGTTPMGSLIAAVTRTAFAVPTAFHVSQTAHFTDTVYLGAWPSSVLARVGGFDERLRANEDYELNYRTRRAGGRIYLSLAIRSTYFGRQTLPALARQYLRYGLGKAQMLVKHPASLKPRQLVAPLFVAALVASLVWWPLGAGGHLLRLGMLVAYAALSLGFSTIVALGAARGHSDRPDQSGGSHGPGGSDGSARFSWWQALLLAPLIYLTIHLAWGVGFWVGLLDVPSWWGQASHRANGQPGILSPADTYVAASEHFDRSPRLQRGDSWAAHCEPDRGCPPL